MSSMNRYADAGLTTMELRCLLGKVLHTSSSTAAAVTFVGVYARDETLARLHDSVRLAYHYPACFVSNTDVSSKPGSHSVALYLPDARHCEFFDSYGLSPSSYDFTFPASLAHVSHSDTTLQQEHTVVCGHYCAYFLILRSLSSDRRDALHSCVRQLSKLNSDSIIQYRINRMRASLACTSPADCPAGSQCCNTRSSMCQTKQ